MIHRYPLSHPIALIVAEGALTNDEPFELVVGTWDGVTCSECLGAAEFMEIMEASDP